MVDRSTRAIRQLAKRLAALEKGNAQRQLPQLAHSSIENGGITEYDKDGNEASRIGLQKDNTHTVASLSGPRPPQPSPPVMSEGNVGAFSAAWDGTYVDVLVAPIDFARMEVHVGKTPDFAPDPLPQSKTRFATIEPAGGGEAVLAMDAGDYFVRLVTRSHSGKFSEPSDAAVVSVSSPMDRDDVISIIEQAGTGNRVFYATTEPDQDGTREGDTWRQIEPSPGTNIVAEWRWTGTGWVRQELTGAVITNLDAGKITAGAIHAAITIASDGAIIAGDPEGAHAALTRDGFSAVSVTADGDQYTSTRLGGVEGSDELEIIAEAGEPPVAAISSDGRAAFRSVDSDQDMSVGGVPLVGRLLNPQDTISRINWSPVSDFEDGSVGAALNNPASLSVVTTQAHSGTRSLQVTYSGTDNRVWWAVPAASLSVTAGDQLTVSAWVYLPAATTAYGEVLYLGGSIVSPVRVAPDWNLRDQWQRVVSTSTVTNPAGTCLPAILMPTGGQSIYVDDVQFETGAAATDAFSGNSTDPAGEVSYRFEDNPPRSVEYVPAAPLGIMDQLARGVVAPYNFRDLPTMSNQTGQSSYGSIGQIDVTLTGGRSYQITMPWRVLPSKVSGSTATELVFACRLFATFTTDGSEPPLPTTSGSTPLASNDSRTPATRATGDGELLSATLGVNVDTRVKLLVALYADTGTQLTPSTYALLDWIAWIQDIGQATSLLAAAPPGGSSQQILTTTWQASDSRTWLQNGSRYDTGTGTRPAPGSLILQGAPNSHGAVLFNSAAVSGDEKGKTIAQAHTGATLIKTEVYLWQAWSEQDTGGQVKLRPWTGTTLPTTKAPPTGASGAAHDFASRSQGAWITIPQSWITATQTGIWIASPDWLFPNTHINVAGATAVAARRPMFRSTYYKVR